MSDERPDQPDQSPADQPDQEPIPVNEPPTTEAPPIDLSGEVPPGGDPVAVPHTDSVVEEWFDSFIRGSVAGQSTQVWNHLVAAKERLKDKLRSL